MVRAPYSALAKKGDRSFLPSSPLARFHEERFEISWRNSRRSGVSLIPNVSLRIDQLSPSPWFTHLRVWGDVVVVTNEDFS